MRILVTGSRGKVGSATVDALHQAGHDVTACDLGAPVFEAAGPDVAALHAGRPDRRRRRLRGRPRPRRRHPRRRAARADAQPGAPRLPEQPDGRRSTRSRPPSAGACPATSTCRARPSPGFFFPERAVPARLRAGRRGAPDPPAGSVRDSPSTSPSCCATPRCGARTSAASRSARAGSSGRATTPTTSAPRCATRSPRPAPRCGPTSTSTTSPTALRLGRRVATSTPTRSSTSPAPTTARNRPLEELDPPPPRRRDRAARARPPGRVRPLDREGAAPARLRPAALLARLPRPRTASCSTPPASGSTRGDTGVQRGRAIA